MVYVVINAEDFADLRMFNRNQEVLTLTSSAHDLRRGLQGTIWGAKIYVSRLIPKGTALVTPELLEPNSPEWEPDSNYLVEIPEPPEPIPRVPGRTAWERLIEDE